MFAKWQNKGKEVEINLFFAQKLMFSASLGRLHNVLATKILCHLQSHEHKWKVVEIKAFSLDLRWRGLNNTSPILWGVSGIRSIGITSRAAEDTQYVKNVVKKTPMIRRKNILMILNPITLKRTTQHFWNIAIYIYKGEKRNHGDEFFRSKKNTEFMYEISYLCQCISEDKFN